MNTANDTAQPDASSAFEDSLPTTSGAALAHLDSLGIAYDLHTHPPLRTVAESRAHTGNLPGVHIKNLFLRDNKKKNYLVVAGELREIDLKSLAGEIGSGRLSFGSAERLMEFLGVRPGAVTPLALMNDPECRVRLAIDRAVLAGDKVNLHPLVNDKTVAVSVADLRKFLENSGHWQGHIEIG